MVFWFYFHVIGQPMHPSHIRQFSPLSPNHQWCAGSMQADAGCYCLSSGYFPTPSPTGERIPAWWIYQMHPHFGIWLVTLARASRLGARTSSANTYAEEPLMLLSSSCYPDALNTECSLSLRRNERTGVFLGCDAHSQFNSSWQLT